MKLSHEQAHRRFESALDIAHFYGQIPKLDTLLSEHLAECPECSAYAEKITRVDAHLNQHLPEIWPAPGFSNQAIDHAILEFHKNENTVKHRIFWGKIWLATQWGIGLVGFALLVGVLLFSMRLLPQKKGVSMVSQPGLAGPLLTPQTEPTELPALSVTPTPQAPAKPITVEWSAVTDFGKLIFFVDDKVTRIKRVSFQFSDWTCGDIPQDGEIVDASRWLIVDNKFSIYSTFDQAGLLTMVVNGTYDEIKYKLYGTWEEASKGKICSGYWEATVLQPK